MERDPNNGIDCRIFESVGRLMMKAIFERVSVAVPVCPSVFKHILEQPPTLLDLEVHEHILKIAISV